MEKVLILIRSTEAMKTTKYFDYTKQRPDREMIRDEWIRQTIEFPIETSRQADGRFRKWSYIQEMDKYLRVILMDDGETVHNACFDRSFKRGVKA